MRLLRLNAGEIEQAPNDLALQALNGYYTFPFSTSSFPTQRPGGTALINGDRLYLHDLWWRWHNGYWRTEQSYLATLNLLNLTSTPGFPYGLLGARGWNLWLDVFQISAFCGTTSNSTNYWTATLQRRSATGETNEATVSLNNLAANQYGSAAVLLNVHRDLAALGTLGWLVSIGRVGTPGQLSRISVDLAYRFAGIP